MFYIIAARRELIRLLDSARHDARPVGMVHLVGAGPGDPDLLTLKAHLKRLPSKLLMPLPKKMQFL